MGLGGGRSTQQFEGGGEFERLGVALLKLELFLDEADFESGGLGVGRGVVRELFGVYNHDLFHLGEGVVEFL